MDILAHLYFSIQVHIARDKLVCQAIISIGCRPIRPVQNVMVAVYWMEHMAGIYFFRTVPVISLRGKYDIRFCICQGIGQVVINPVYPIENGIDRCISRRGDHTKAVKTPGTFLVIIPALKDIAIRGCRCDGRLQFLIYGYSLDLMCVVIRCEVIRRRGHCFILSCHIVMDRGLRPLHIRHERIVCHHAVTWHIRLIVCGEP